MIGSLRGIVLEIHPPIGLIEVGGIGYRIHATPSLLANLHAGEEAFVYIHDLIREDAHELYAFASLEDLRLFERMIAISGVGPKVALAILSVGSAEILKRAIMSGDLTTLTSVPGVGKKIAQKIILELKGQIVEADEVSGTDGEVIEALVSLGYSSAQAKDAIKNLSPDITDVSERIREALKSIA